MDEMKEKWYTVKQAAEKTRFSVAVINNACRKGELEASQIPDHTKYGFHYSVSESKLNAWVATRKANVAEAKTYEEVSAIVYKLIKEEYERGFKEGKEAARRAFTEAVKGMK